MSQIEQQLKTLEERMLQLFELCETYKRQNRSLRTREAQLLDERAQLLKKNDQARAKVEAMISRLKAMEQDSS